MARRDGGLHPPPLVPRRRITSTQIPFEILSGHESSAAVCGRGTDRPTERDGREGGQAAGGRRNCPNIPLYSTDGWRYFFLSQERKSYDSNTNVISLRCNF